jgi:5-methyltetrahydrofolate--homocysteine methyltransferase
VPREPFAEAARKRRLLFDGAMGTEIQKLNPGPEDFPDGKDGFNDGLILTRPEWIKDIHRSYLKAGADCIETNTFGSNKFKLDEYGYGGQTVEFNRKAAQLAREAADEFEDRYVIGSMGPSGFLPSSNDPDLGQKSLEEIREAFALQAEGLILLGTSVQSAYTTVSDMGIDFFGLNCSTGPVEMEPSVKWLAEQDLPILVMPNAGMPHNEGGRAVYKMGPDEIAHRMAGFVKSYPNVRMIGGCCGTDPRHISELRRVLDNEHG